MNKKFTSALRQDIVTKRTGLLGFGRKVEFREGGNTKNPVTYRVDRRNLNEETAATINSRIPMATLRKPQ